MLARASYKLGSEAVEACVYRETRHGGAVRGGCGGRVGRETRWKPLLEITVEFGLSHAQCPFFHVLLAICFL